MSKEPRKILEIKERDILGVEMEKNRVVLKSQGGVDKERPRGDESG
jgi:hypothetical protein